MEGKQGEARMLIEDMIEDGFTQEQVYRAVNAEYQRLQPKEDEVSEGQAATMFQRQDLFDAMEADSEESFALVKEELLASGKSESSILSAVKEYAKTMYDDAAPREKIMHVLKDYGGMSDNEAKNQYDTIEKTWLEENEPRVQEAAEAWVAQNMTKANELIDEMTHEGFGVNAVRKAFRETLNDLLPDEEKADEYNDVDLYRNSDLRYALDNRNLTAFEEIARGIEEESGTDKRASVTKTYAREMYDEKPKNKAEILDVLQRFGGLTEAEALTEYDTIEKNWLLDNDERVQTAGEQWYAMDLDKSEATVDALIKDGYSKNAVLAAVRSVVNDLTPKSEKEKEYTDVQYYRNADLKNAISHNDKAAFNRIAGRIAEETGAESAEGVAKSYAKELYADTGDADQAAKVLTGYAGKTKDEAETITAWWEYQAKHADTVLTEASFGSYYDKIVKNNVGIPASVYEQFYAQKKEVKGLDENGDGKTDSGSKRNQVAAIIAKLKLTPAQKTALWDMQGYARKYMPNWQ